MTGQLALRMRSSGVATRWALGVVLVWASSAWADADPRLRVEAGPTTLVGEDVTSEPILDQHDAIREYRASRAPVLDVDPDTGEPESGETDTGDGSESAAAAPDDGSESDADATATAADRAATPRSRPAARSSA